MASDNGVPSTFKYEEFGEYLLIEEKPKQVAHPEHIITEDNVERRFDSSLDSGYEGKHSRAWSPEVKAEQKPLQTEENEQEEWCVIEQEKHRPQGLYGYRYVDYDDEEAEGNIHITDEDL